MGLTTPAAARRPRRLGMLIPSSNTIVETVTPHLLPQDGSITAHVSRLEVVTISAEAASLGQFATEPFRRAARLLADAAVDLILWNGTAAGWLGFDWDARIVETIERETRIRTTTAVGAISRRLAALGARRIGLVTPYVAELETKIADHYAAAGFPVVAAERLNLTVNTTFAAVTPDEVGAMVRRLAPAAPDAIVILCTNLAGATVAEPLATELGIPVIDSVRVAVEESCALLRAMPT